jgi:hypothetical protein
VVVATVGAALGDIDGDNVVVVVVALVGAADGGTVVVAYVGAADGDDVVEVVAIVGTVLGATDGDNVVVVELDGAVLGCDVGEVDVG